MQKIFGTGEEYDPELLAKCLEITNWNINDLPLKITPKSCHRFLEIFQRYNQREERKIFRCTQ